MRYATKYGFELETAPNTFFAGELQRERCWEDAEAQLILSLLRPLDQAVDAGAHVGYFACLMARARANVLVIEPNPRLTEALFDNLARVGERGELKFELVALSDVNGDAPFYLPSSWDDGWGSLAAADYGDRSRAITVPVRRFDGLLPPGRIRLIKLDVEGAETLALRGLGERLVDVDYLLVECVDISFRVARSGSCVAGINELLAGFQVRGFDEVSGSWEPMDRAVSFFDNSFLFVNPRVAGEWPR